MNEKFLSRGKREDNGEWVTGYYVKLPEHHIIFDLDGDVDYIIPETVGRCTSLTDKNGKMIFEGDILQTGEYRFTVKFGKCGGVKNVDHEVGYIGFYVIPIGKDSELFIESGVRTDILYWLNAYEVYVIGNIHDNPELIGGTE